MPAGGLSHTLRSQILLLNIFLGAAPCSVSKGEVQDAKGKSSISQMLADRAAANASKAASLANERKKLHKQKQAKSSGAKKEDASSEVSVDDKEDYDDEDSVFRKAPLSPVRQRF